jgi:Kef-type K+ transport system membrane component KefB
MSSDEFVGRLLLDVGIVVAVSWVFTVLLGRFREPPAIGAILGGIVLGPSVLGALPGDPSATLFPSVIRSALSGVGGIGVVLFLFLVGADLDLAAIKRSGRAVASVSIGSLALPLALGLALASVLHDSHKVVGGHVVGFVPFALFMMTALSITAFPVLVSILADRGLQRTRVGLISTASAAAQDAAGWVLLAIALAALHAAGPASLFRIAAETAAYLFILVRVVRPVLRAVCKHWASEDGSLNAQSFTIVLIGLFASAAATQMIGLHSFFGAFFYGLALPRERNAGLIEGLHHAVSPLTRAVLLPVFFLAPGLGVRLGVLNGHALAELALIFACACVGKLVGAGIGCRIAGLDRDDTLQLSVLMNTRGLIELIVLNVGLTAGVLDQRLFTEMVLMAILTTLMTTPLLDFLSRRKLPEPAARSSAGGGTRTQAVGWTKRRRRRP